ncbi:alpha/beta-Hydrolases superfamily protein [Zea mays]|uniref:Alpha/beta-Hydrolases superfamily protein n=1 Tax=Zea mays TaxID=4577 RepID=A0A1D6EPY8_MAIZE|nr:alpha/beta-Hydrolases superfamily protein [Zea mays]
MPPSAAATAAAFLFPAVAIPCRVFPQRRARSLAVRAVASPPAFAVKPAPLPSKTGKWEWKFENKPVNIYYEEHEQEVAENMKNILMIPTISDVSTVEEWRVVAKDIVGRKGELGYRVTIVDWPGLGYSDRPSLNYNADVMESFLVELMNSPNSPVANADDELIIVGGGHAATIAVRAAGKDLIKPSAVAAVAPTWAGPLPIVFGRGSDMETSYDRTGGPTTNNWNQDPDQFGPLKRPVKSGYKELLRNRWRGGVHMRGPELFTCREGNREKRAGMRYGLLRGTLRAPALGWMMYNVLVSNEKSIQSQYKSHVYANPDNVTPAIIESRYELTKRKGARFVPAAFLTGLLDPVQSREEFLQLFAKLDGDVPVLVVSTVNAPKRSKAEMEALRGSKGVTKFVEVAGALLPQEEYPLAVAEELYSFLQESFAARR